MFANIHCCPKNFSSFTEDKIFSIFSMLSQKSGKTVKLCSSKVRQIVSHLWSTPPSSPFDPSPALPLSPPTKKALYCNTCYESFAAESTTQLSCGRYLDVGSRDIRFEAWFEPVDYESLRLSTHVFFSPECS